MEKFTHRRVIIFLGILNALTPFTIDLYLPAFADIAQDLGTNVARVSLSVATYFIGYALGQLMYGPFLDRYGRKSPIVVGLLIYIAATVGCLTAQSIEALLVFRFLSALGGSAASVGAVAMVRDYFDPKEGAKVFSMLMLVLSVSPLFAPTLGGWMAIQWGWRSVFAFLIVLAVIDLAIVMGGLPKAYGGDRNLSLRPGSLARGFAEIFRVSEFRTHAFAGALSFAGLFVYLTGSPAIFIEGYGFSKQGYSTIFAFLACAMIGGGQVNNQLMKKYSSSVIFRKAILTEMVTSLLFVAVLFITPVGPTVAIGFFFFILLSAGIAYPNAAALAMGSFSENAGRASALLGFIQMGVGALLAALVGMIDYPGTLPTAIVIGLSSLLAWLVLYWSQGLKS